MKLNSIAPSAPEITAVAYPNSNELKVAANVVPVTAWMWLLVTFASFIANPFCSGPAQAGQRARRPASPEFADAPVVHAPGLRHETHHHECSQHSEAAVEEERESAVCKRVQCSVAEHDRKRERHQEIGDPLSGDGERHGLNADRRRKNLPHQNPDDGTE